MIGIVGRQRGKILDLPSQRFESSWVRHKIKDLAVTFWPTSPLILAWGSTGVPQNPRFFGCFGGFQTVPISAARPSPQTWERAPV